MNSLRYSYKNGKIRNTKLIIIVAASATAVVLLLLAFFAGYALRGALMVSSSDWVINMISKYYYQDIDTSDSEDIAADALVDKYLDIYSEYYTAEEYEALLKSNGGTSSGLGISYAYIPGSGITIVGSTGNSPAFKAGIRPGDVITKVNGKSVASAEDLSRIIKDEGVKRGAVMLQIMRRGDVFFRPVPLPQK